MGRKHIEFNPECGKRVKEWFKEADVKQNAAAKMINWSQQHISNVINGNERLTPDRAKDIADKIPNKEGEHVLVDYLLCNIDCKTEKELFHSKYTTLCNRSDLVSDLVESLGYNLTHKNILSRDEKGEFYIPMVEIMNNAGKCRYMCENEYGAFIEKIVDIVAGLLLVEMDYLKRGRENG